MLEQISEKAKQMDLLVIADAKRGDIGSTAKAYAEAFLGKNRPFDALTVNPYLGQDGILPLQKQQNRTEREFFVICQNE